MAATARGDDQRRRHGQRHGGPCAVFHAYLHWASAPPRLASHSSWVVPQVKPGRAAWEGDTPLSGLLVAESEPDHDGTPGLPDIHPGVRSANFGTFLQADDVVRGSGGSGGSGGAGSGVGGSTATRRRSTGEVE